MIRRVTASMSLVAVVMLGTAPAAVKPADPRAWVGMALVDVLGKLRADGVNIVYSDELVRPEMVVTEVPSGGSTLEILDALLAPHGLAARDGPNGIVMVVARPRSPTSFGAIRGLVRARDTGLPLRGASVRLSGWEQPTWTDRDGRFELIGLRQGIYTLEVHTSGYLAVQRDFEVVAGQATEIQLELAPQPRYLQEVVVTPSRYGFLHRQPESRQFLGREEVQQLPHLSDDVFRVVQRLPGTNSGDLSAAVGIRGGGPDEVMIVLDGLQIYEPYHLRHFQNLLSIIDSEAVGGVELRTGGFPVEYGDRMSGIVDISSSLPERRRTSVGASFFTLRGSAEGAGGDGLSSWLVSARRGFLDVAFAWLERIDEEPGFIASPVYYDLYASLQRPLGKRSVISAHLLGSYDDIRLSEKDEPSEADGHHSSWYLWTQLFTRWRGGLSSRTVISASGLVSSLDGTSFDPSDVSTETTDDRGFDVLGFKQDWILETSRSHLFKWGADLRRMRSTYHYHRYSETLDLLADGGEPADVTEVESHLHPSGWQIGLYAADRFRLAPGVTVETGMRWDRQTWTPGDDQISPRLNLVWELGSVGTVRASWGRYAQSQGVHELQVEDGVNTFFPAQWAEHQVLSFESAPSSGIGFKAEVYRKTMTDLRPRFENLFEPFEWFPAGERDRVRLDPDRAVARGLELVLKGAPSRRWSWWAGYSLSAVDDRIDGAWQPRSWDQRNALNLSVNWQPGKQWNLNLAGAYHTGWPTTPVTGRWQQQPDGPWVIVGVLGERNSDRYPDYLRFDVRASRTFHRPASTLRIFFEITNLLARENVRSTSDIYFVPGPGGTIETQPDYENWLPILPSFGIIYEF
jgi:outer membrane receptor protein involved in Fe transport